MGTFKFGKPTITSEDVSKEVFELMGFEFPIEFTVINNNITEFSFETEWKVGGTTPIEETDEKGNTTITGYAEDYQSFQMTEEHINKLKQWAAENVIS